MFITLEKIVINITYACPSRCMHCQMGTASPAGGAVNGALAARELQQLAAKHPVGEILIFGGEPMLFPDRVYQVAHAARDAGIPTVTMITNGYVQGKSDPENARRAAADAVRAGITSFLLSVDGFHAPHVPYPVVRAFAEGLLAAHAHARLQPAWLVSPDADNIHNARTREALSRFADLDIPVGDGNVVFPAGCAAEHLSEYFTQPALADLRDYRCGVAPYTSALDAVGELHITPDNRVQVCGFAIGDLRTRPLTDIVESYDPHADPVMSLLMRQGPYALWEEACARGIPVDTSRVYTGCDLCTAVCRSMGIIQ